MFSKNNSIFIHFIVTGQIIDSSGNAVATIQTNHEGRGKFSYTPVKGENYKVKIISPNGITFQNPLPPAKDGVVISSVNDVYSSTSVKFNFGSTSKGSFLIHLSKKFKLLESKSVEIENTEKLKSVAFDLSQMSSVCHGVLRVKNSFFLLCSSKN